MAKFTAGFWLAAAIGWHYVAKACRFMCNISHAASMKCFDYRDECIGAPRD